MIQKNNAENKKLSWLLILTLAILLTSCSGPPKVDWTLTISGGVSAPTTFTYQELAEMEQVNLNDVLMEKSRGEDEVLSFSGVPIDDLLNATGAPKDYSSLTAIAADGYAIEISKDEMIGGIVAMNQNGEWISKADPDAGPIRLVFPQTPANRWVFQITELIVNQ